MSKDAVDEMLTVDDETADALAEFDFVMGEDSGSVFIFAFLFPDGKVYIFPLNHKKIQNLSVKRLLTKIQLVAASFSEFCA